MHYSPPPKASALLGLATLAVELPFLVTCLLVQVLRSCPHCRHEWLSWPILPGAFPWFFAAISLKSIPRDAGIVPMKCGWAVFTVCLIGLIFAACRQNAFWQLVLAAGVLVSSALAVVTFMLIAA